MVLDKEDFISISDKTFDLSLDDCSSLKEKPPVTANILEDTSSTVVETKTTEVTGGDLKAPTNFTTYRAKLNSPNLSNHSLRDSEVSMKTLHHLMESIGTLSKACGNQNVTINEMNNENDLEDDIAKLAKILNQLSQNCALKLTFYESNYKFVEGLHETSNNENEALRQKILTKDQTLNELEERYDLLKREHLNLLENKQDEKSNKTKVYTQGLDQFSNIQPPNYDNETYQLVVKQRKEINEYKRFIKELMERD